MCSTRKDWQVERRENEPRPSSVFQNTEVKFILMAYDRWEELVPEDSWKAPDPFWNQALVVSVERWNL